MTTPGSLIATDTAILNHHVLATSLPLEVPHWPLSPPSLSHHDQLLDHSFEAKGFGVSHLLLS